MRARSDVRGAGVSVRPDLQPVRQRPVRLWRGRAGISPQGFNGLLFPALWAGVLVIS